MSYLNVKKAERLILAFFQTLEETKTNIENIEKEEDLSWLDELLSTI